MYSRQIYAFVVVAEAGSFSKASERLFTTTAGVMKKINTLEERIGVKLFNRTNHGVTLTHAGEEVYLAAKKIIELSQSTIKKLQADDKELSVRIGTTLLYPAEPLVELWAKVPAKQAAVKINIVPMGNSYTNLSSLTEELGKSIDCFAAGYDANSVLKNCGVFPLEENPCHISVPRNHRLAEKKLLSWADLEGEHLMLLQKGQSPIIDKIRQEILSHHPRIHIIDVPDFYNAEVFNECVAKGYLLETPSIWGNIHPAMVSLPMAWDYHLKFGLIYLKKPNPAVKMFLEEIKKMKGMKEE